MKVGKKVTGLALTLVAILCILSFVQGGGRHRAPRKYLPGATVDDVRLLVSPDGLRTISGNLRGVAVPAGAQICFNQYDAEGIIIGEIVSSPLPAERGAAPAFALPITDRCQGFNFVGAFRP